MAQVEYDKLFSPQSIERLLDYVNYKSGFTSAWLSQGVSLFEIYSASAVFIFVLVVIMQDFVVLTDDGKNEVRKLSLSWLIISNILGYWGVIYVLTTISSSHTYRSVQHNIDRDKIGQLLRVETGDESLDSSYVSKYCEPRENTDTVRCYLNWKIQKIATTGELTQETLKKSLDNALKKAKGQDLKEKVEAEKQK